MVPTTTLKFFQGFALCLLLQHTFEVKTISRCNIKALGLHLNFCEILALFIANLSKLCNWAFPARELREYLQRRFELWLGVSTERRGRDYCQDTKLSCQGLPDRHRLVTSDWEHTEQRRTKYHQQWGLSLSVESDIPSLQHPLIVISEHSAIPGLSPS